MRARLVLLGLVLVVAALVAAQVPGAKAPFVVHEWGTFTSMQGSDGITLEGLHHEEEPLPGFVYSRTAVRECPLRNSGYKGLEVPVESVTQKMETPVLYFYSDVARDVRVRVEFERGLLTQWYPVVDRLGPAEPAEGAERLDLAKVPSSFLEWDVEVLPVDSRSPGSLPIPEVAAGDPWAFARETGASLLRTKPRQAPRMGPVEAEHYLFYRGLGSFDPPVTATTEARARGAFKNGATEPVPSAIALEMTKKGGRFLDLGAVAAGGAVSFDLEAQAMRSGSRVSRDLEDLVARRLVEQGLYTDEARAMVRTWSRSWFRSLGLRIIYVVPGNVTRAILPLAITPAPDELVRVLVGRLECITPAAEARVERALRGRFDADPAKREAATRVLTDLGRFLEPHVRRALATTSDPLVRGSAAAVLASLSGPPTER